MVNYVVVFILHSIVNVHTHKEKYSWFTRLLQVWEDIIMNNTPVKISKCKPLALVGITICIG